MTGPNVRSWSYARGSPLMAIPWVQTTNWSMSPRKPSTGRRMSRAIEPTTRAPTRRASSRPDHRVASGAATASTTMRSDAAGRPVPLGGPGHVTDARHHRPVLAHRVGHRLSAVEQALHLALVQGDAHDLAFELIGDVGVLGEDADVRRQRRERVGAEVTQAAEVVPPGVRKVLVERDHPGIVGPGHHPATAVLEQPDADLAAQLVVDMATDPKRKVDLLGLEPGDLLAQR